MKKNFVYFCCMLLLASCSFMEVKKTSTPVKKAEISLPEATAFALKEHLDSQLEELSDALSDTPDDLEEFNTLTKEAGYTYLISKNSKLKTEIQEAWYRLEFGLQVLEKDPLKEKTPYQYQSKASYLAEKTRLLYWKALSAEKMQKKVYNLIYALENEIKHEKDCDKKDKLEDDLEKLVELSNKLKKASKAFFAFIEKEGDDYRFRPLGQEKMALPFAPQNSIGYEIKALNDRVELKPYTFEPQVERVALLKQIETLTPFLKKQSEKSHFSSYATSWIEISDFISTEGYNKTLSAEGKRHALGVNILNQFHLSWALYNLVLQDYRLLSHQLQSAQKKIKVIKCYDKNLKEEDIKKNIAFLEKTIDTHFAYADLQYSLGLLLHSISGLKAIDNESTLQDLKLRRLSLDFGDFTKENVPLPPPMARLKPPVPTFISLEEVNPIANTKFELVVPKELFDEACLEEDATFTATLDDGSKLPDWLHFDAETLTFSGIPPIKKESFKIMILGQDKTGQKTFTVFDMNIGMEAVEIMALYGEEKPHHRVAVMRKCPIGLCSSYPFEQEEVEEPVYIRPVK
ncbi:MAG: putative Ig domain-containing protein [Alphaproteobacteria bacterium]|nr:putative Ig domain-containing protein [Alphaproteobacteria bacterium]